jgi:hypothetical protein
MPLDIRSKNLQVDEALGASQNLVVPVSGPAEARLRCGAAGWEQSVNGGAWAPLGGGGGAPALWRGAFTEEIAIGAAASVVSAGFLTVPLATLIAAVDKTLKIRVWGGRDNIGGVGGGCPLINVGGFDYSLGNPAADGENWHSDASGEYESANSLRTNVSQLKYRPNYMSYVQYGQAIGDKWASALTLVNTGINWWNTGDLKIYATFSDRTGLACNFRFTVIAEIER